MRSVLLIGIDCAVDPANTGLCLAMYREGKVCTVLEGCSGSRETTPGEITARWIRENPGLPVVLGMDAPLGWPEAMSGALISHRAGQALHLPANTLFRRYTDDFTAVTLGKRPMDVGADRIARTAHAALRLLDEIRRLSNLSFPTGWSPGTREGSVVLETYPAAWLKGTGLPDRGYKGREQRLQRERILEGIDSQLGFDTSRDPFLDDADILDALLCTRVCRDYLEGRVFQPPAAMMERVRREGWIWLPDYSGSAPAITSR